MPIFPKFIISKIKALSLNPANIDCYMLYWCFKNMCTPKIPFLCRHFIIKDQNPTSDIHVSPWWWPLPHLMLKPTQTECNLGQADDAAFSVRQIKSWYSAKALVCLVAIQPNWSCCVMAIDKSLDKHFVGPGFLHIFLLISYLFSGQKEKNNNKEMKDNTTEHDH